MREQRGGGVGLAGPGRPLHQHLRRPVDPLDDLALPVVHRHRQEHLVVDGHPGAVAGVGGAARPVIRVDQRHHTFRHLAGVGKLGDDRVEDLHHAALGTPAQDERGSERGARVSGDGGFGVLVEVFAVGVEGVHQPAREGAGLLPVQRVRLELAGQLAGLVHLVRGADHPGVEHVQLHLEHVRTVTPAHGQPRGLLVEVEGHRAGQHVPPDGVVPVGAPGEQTGAQHQFQLLRAVGGPDVEGEQLVVLLAHDPVVGLLFRPGTPIVEPTVEGGLDLRGVGETDRAVTGGFRAIGVGSAVLGVVVHGVVGPGDGFSGGDPDRLAQPRLGVRLIERSLDPAPELALGFRRVDTGHPVDDQDRVVRVRVIVIVVRACDRGMVGRTVVQPQHRALTPVGVEGAGCGRLQRLCPLEELEEVACPFGDLGGGPVRFRHRTSPRVTPFTATSPRCTRTPASLHNRSDLALTGSMLAPSDVVPTTRGVTVGYRSAMRFGQRGFGRRTA